MEQNRRYNDYGALHRNSENKLMIEITAQDQKWIEVVKNYRM